MEGFIGAGYDGTQRGQDVGAQDFTENAETDSRDIQQRQPAETDRKNLAAETYSRDIQQRQAAKPDSRDRQERHPAETDSRDRQQKTTAETLGAGV